MSRLLQRTLLLALFCAFCPLPAFAQDAETPTPIYEVRSYHFEPSLLDAYKTWATDHLLPYLHERMEVVGFWAATDLPAEVSGAPLDDMGSANITWVIRWENKEVRDAQMPDIFGSSEWEAVFAKGPGNGYLRVEARFMEGLK